MYKANINTGSVLEYALAFTSAALDKYCSKWSAAPKTGFIDITTSKDFYRIFSGLQFVRNFLKPLCPIAVMCSQYVLYCKARCKKSLGFIYQSSYVLLTSIAIFRVYG